jgi:pimeloyl-ACP methyl ester carboxylesterase
MSGWTRAFSLFLTVATSIATAWSQPAKQPSEQLWDIGTKQIFLSCSGQRHGAVVILEAGRGRTSADWSKVQPNVARYTKVCSYDRAGLGRSEPHSAQVPADDPAQSVNDLHQLLTVASIQPPYVLVGHSLGGLLVRWYQSKYPNEVKGLVLLDPLHEEALWHALEFDPQAANGISLNLADLRRSGKLPPREHLTWHCDIPLIVLRHGIPINFPPPLNAIQPQYEALYIALDQDLASRSPHGQLRLAERSGHFIQVDQPQLVIDEIHDVWAEAPSYVK